MTEAAPARSPWIAAILALILGPFFAMLYLGRGALAILYLVLGIVAAFAVLLLLPQLVSGGISAGTTWLAQLPVALIGTVHAVLLARRRATGGVWYSRWYALVGFFVLFPLIAIGIRTFLFQPFSIASASMEPTLSIGDYVFVTKFAYASVAPARGDIVAFHHAGEIYMKRVVGLPGDSVQLRGGILYLNGAAVPRRRIGTDASMHCFGPARCEATIYEETLPGGRAARVLDLGETEGDDTGVFQVPPGAYFVLGDNRDNSADSRFGEIGFIPRAGIVGRADRMFVHAGHWTWQPVR